MKSQCRVAAASEFFLSVQVGAAVLTGVYLPPRLTDAAVSLIMASIPSSDLLAGDLNFRQRSNGDSCNTFRERAELVFTAMVRQSLELVKNSNWQTDCSRNDYVFSKVAVSWTYDSIFAGSEEIRSDHGLMDITARLPVQRGVESNPNRFNCKPLETPEFRVYFCQQWDFLAGSNLTKLSKQVLEDLAAGNLAGRQQATLDVLYDIFVGEISNLCGSELFEYNANEIKAMVDRSTELAKSEISTRHIIRCFKRSQRFYQTTHPIIARDETTSPVKEATDHYSKILGTRKEGFDVELEELEESLDIEWASSMKQEDVQKRIDWYPSAKSSGFDNISPRLLKVLAASATFTSILTDLYRICLATGYIPKAWLSAKLHLLQKDAAEPFADKTRPINLSSIFRRIFEKILDKRIDTIDSGPWLNLHANQAGFRKGYSTISHILLSDQLSRDGYKESIFLDLKSAYDTVPWHRVLQLLVKRGCPRPICRLIQSLMLSPASLYLSLNHTLASNPIKSMRGLFQGSVLSPRLFSVFIDTLADLLADADPAALALLFADDIVLKAKNYKSARLLVSLAETWATENGLDWGISKCATTTLQDILLAGQNIPKVNPTTGYKYLGIPHGKKGILWHLHVAQATEKQKRFLGAFQQRAQSWSPFARLTVWKTFARPIVEYGIAPALIWAESNQKKSDGKRIMDLLKVSHEQGVTFVVGQSNFQSIMANVTGLGNFQHRADFLRASLAWQISRFTDSNPFNTYLRPRPRDDPDCIVYLCKRSALVVQFKKDQPDPAKWKHGWKKWHTKRLLKHYDTTDSKLDKYISPKCRSSRSLVDHCIHQPLIEAKNSILWRFNFAFARQVCKCGELFNRRHVTDCSLLSSDFKYLENLLSDEFIVNFGRVSNLFQAVKSLITEPVHYTVLDFALDIMDYDLFNHCFALLKAALTH